MRFEGGRDTSTAHPRSRGEHYTPGGRGGDGWGSSPLTRGAHAMPGPALSCMGLIPAHAGSTGPPPAPAQRLPAHPRSRGEHNLRGQLAVHYRGSSPLTRGALARVVGGVESAGLIPAHAGSTIFMEVAENLPWAHPRSRGEHTSASAAMVCLMGSSPLTRGAPAGASRGRHTPGLIPAHAGSTQFFPSALEERRAHPRSRGEHTC